MCIRDRNEYSPDGFTSVLEYASKELQNDREVVLAAVTQNGYALNFASEELKRDREVVLAAIVEFLQHTKKKNIP